MKKKLYITRVVKITCFLLAITISLSLLQTYFLRRLDHNSTRLNGYYQEKDESLDVVLLGASEIYTSFSAGLAYNKYGFTSYPFATESITAAGTITALKEIVRTQNPKLILIEPNAFLYSNTKNEEMEPHIRKLIDNIPLNSNKIEYINNNVEPDEKLEYYVPLIKYHGMWRDYPEPARRVVSTILQDIRGRSILKGYRTTTDIYNSDVKKINKRVDSETGVIPLNNELEQKLRELLTYCVEQNLNVVFVRMPHMVYKKTYDRVKRSNRAEQIVKGYGFDYLNLERAWDKIGIDIKTDYYNLDHLNIYGTVKMTTYLGNIIQNDYGIGKSELSDSEKENWDSAAKSFNQLYRYCDDLIKRDERIQLEEDINTLRAIEDYSSEDFW